MTIGVSTSQNDVSRELSRVICLDSRLTTQLTVGIAPQSDGAEFQKTDRAGSIQGQAARCAYLLPVGMRRYG
jgi:hypothetical protein